MFIIIENNDSAGYDSGFSHNNPTYKNGFIAEDGYEIIKAIQVRKTYETKDRFIIIFSDHGGVGTGSGRPTIQKRMIFVFMNRDWK